MSVSWQHLDLDDDEDEGGDVFLPSHLEEERHHFHRSATSSKADKTVKCAVWVSASICGVLVLAIIIGAAIVAAVESSRLKKASNPSGTHATTASTPPSLDLEWWKKTVIYHNYPRSYQDSDGDGSGDISGIISRVEYLSDLGIKAVRLNSIFKSSQRDGGNDISNYTDVDTLFGNLEPLKTLLQMLHDKGMHLLLDIVPNHTSDKHPWFIESQKNKTNPKRSWYVWADGKENGTPPNNWVSVFNGSAWTYDNLTDQYYLHQFSEFQPDLNYSNPEVRLAFENVLRFWLKLGVDGFVIDSVVHLLEDPLLRDEPLNPNSSSDCNDVCYDHLIHNYTRNYQGIHNIIKSWRKVLDSYSQTRNRFIIGEVDGTIDTAVSYYGKNNDEFHFPLNALFLGTNHWTGTDVNSRVNLWLTNMPEGGWPNWVLGNHDNHRIASVAGPFLARALNVLLLTLPGTPTTYYGEEILMTDVDVPNDQRKDKILDRDKERTPMQWTNESNAGFTSGEPWLPLAKNFSIVNVRSEEKEVTSMLSLYKQLVKMRSTYQAFMIVNYLPVLVTTEVFAYARYSQLHSVCFIVMINFSEQPVSVNVTSTVDFVSSLEVYLSSYLNRTEIGDLNAITLFGGEALILNGSHDS